MRYLSVCSGIEAASVAWHPLGWEAVAFSEIEPFPCSVLAHHYPGVPNWGDMTQWESWPDAAVDVLVGGTPCQSFSVAGKRAGMGDPRGQLALAYVGIAAKYKPQWIVWENDPGVLSSGGGRDFGAFLWALVQLGYGCAWRVLDAQYFGLAQRRKRVFVVGCLGSWQRAAAVLFESPSLRRDTPPSREAGEKVTQAVTCGVAKRGTDELCQGFLTVEPIAFHPTQDPISSERVAHALGAGSKNGQASVAVAFAQNQLGEVRCGDVANTVGTTGNASARATSKALVGHALRRLTPRECERLQGFPDDYTLVTHRNKPAADGPRYKALGNSMAVPCMRLIGERIQMVEEVAGA